MLFSKKETALLAVATGRSIPLSEVPDEAFASGILGEGFAIDPIDGTVYSPVSGAVESIAESLHAYTLHSDDGLDVLVHVGIDTVELGGEGSLPAVSEGARVKAGEVLCRVDLNLLHGKNFPCVIPVVITNPEAAELRTVRACKTVGGQTAVLSYRLNER